MTVDDVFNKVAMHLLVQNEQAYTGTDTCRYHLSFGLKCAIGCLIPAEQYDPRIEGLDVATLAKDWKQVFPAKIQEIIADNLPLFNELQGLHDSQEPPVWPRALLRLAVMFDVEPSKALLDAVAAAGRQEIEA